MAARRERERRRPPAERQYRFGTPQSELDVDDKTVDGAEEVADAVETRTRGRAEREAVVATPQRGGARAAPPPFSAYRSEYQYVLGDLRRVGLVVGSLLVVLLLLYFVLPR